MRNTQEVKTVLVWRSYVILAVLGLFSLFASYSRIPELGIIPIMYLHSAVYLSVLFIGIRFQHISLNTSAWAIVAIFSLLGIGNFATFGVSGLGLFFFGIASLYTTILFGLQRGTIVFFFSILGMTLLAMLFIFEIITVGQDLSQMSLSVSSWLLALTAYIACCGTLIVGSGSLNKFLETAIRSLKHHEEKLQEKVRLRTTELERINKEINLKIEENIRNQTALQESKQKLLEAQKVAGMVFFEWSVSDDVFVTTDEFYPMFGLTHNTPITSQVLLDLTDEDDRDYLQSQIAITIKTGRPLSIEHQINRPDGSIMWLHSQARVTESDEKKSKVLMGTCVDITDLKLMDLEREEALNRLNGVMQAATNTAIIATDKEGFVTVFNLGAESLIGYKAVDVIGRETPMLWHDKQEVLDKSMTLSHQYGKTVSGFTVFTINVEHGLPEQNTWTFHRPDRETRTVNLTVTAIRDSKGEVTGYLGCALDITKEVQMTRALQENEQRIRSMVNNIPGASYRLSVGKHSQLVYISKAIERMTGYLQSDLTEDGNVRYGKLIDKRDAKPTKALLNEAIENGKPFDVDYRIKHADGRERWFNDRGRPIKKEGDEHIWIDGIITDITEQKQQEQALEASEARYASILDNVPSVILRLNRAGKITFSNRPVFHQEVDDIIGHAFADYLDEEGQVNFQEAITKVIELGERKTLEISPGKAYRVSEEIWYQIKMGPIVEENNIVGLTLVATNVTNLVQSEKLQRELALKDHLTGLANRRLFEDRLEYLINLFDRENQPFALIMLDLDKFKPVNDIHGHDVGDRLLCEVANRVKKKIRKIDVAARFGGDEFAVLLNNMSNMPQLEKTANSIINAIREPIDVDGLKLEVGASLGLALYPAHAKSAEELVKRADQALYQAKENGRNRLEVATA